MRSLRSRAQESDGFTLVEMMVAIVLIGLLAAAFLSTSLINITSARANESRTAATQYAQDQLEQVVTQPWSSIGLYATDSGYRSTFNGEPTVTLTTSPRPQSVPQPYPPATSVDGVSYRVRTDITWRDDPADNTGGGGSDSDGDTHDMKHVVVTITWTMQDGVTRTVSVDDLRAATATEVAPTVATSGFSVAVAGPSTQTLGTDGKLTQTMTITATTSKTATSATLTYSNRSGVQSVTMPVGNGTTWSVTLPSGSGPFDTGPTTFKVTAKSTSFGSTSGSVDVPLIIGASGVKLTVGAAPSQELSSTGTLNTAVTVTATGLSNITSASVSYPTKTSTATHALSGSGTNWTYAIPADSTTYNAGLETFTVTVTFADGSTATGLVTISLFQPVALPDVTALTVNDPYSTTGNQSFCVDKNYSTWSAQTIDATVKNVATTDTVKLTAPGFTTLEFPMTYLKTNADGSMVFRYSLASGSSMPSSTSISLQAYALKSISGTSYRDDFVTSPAPKIDMQTKQSGCT